MTSFENSQWPYRWDLLLRFRLIEIISYWEGRLTTKSLISAFGIGRQQASKTINQYIKELAPKNLAYDKNLKGYKPTEEFKPVLTNADISEYLQFINSRQELNGQFSSIEQIFTNTQIITPPTRAIDVAVIRPILRAAKERKRVDIRYWSMSSPTPKERIISPHTVVFNGHRWHVRAFCEDRIEFRDFVLSRIAQVFDLEGQTSKTELDDDAWQSNTKIVITPDKRLTPHQRSVIARDYGMQEEIKSYSTRGALVTYFLQLLNLDCESLHENPNIQQIELVNAEELKQWRF